MDYKAALSVYIIWHPEYEDGQKVANELYSLLCRDIDKPLIRSIGIPVYFRNTKPLKEINFNESINTAIIPLIDSTFVNDNKLSEFVNLLYDEFLKGANKTGIYPIAIGENAFNISAKLSKLNFIRAYKDSITNWEEVFSAIKRPVLHQLCRLLMDLDANYKKPPVKLFISHSKHDDGLKNAKEFKNYVNGETQLNTFFDVNDIPFGSLFAKEIKAAVKESALVVFQSDTYADREWCRMEVLVAKEHGCPITIVNTIRKGETDNILSTSPELFHFIKLKQIHNKEDKDFSLFIYPDPPLGSEELELLNQMDDRFVFITPLTLPSIVKK